MAGATGRVLAGRQVLRPPAVAAVVVSVVINNVLAFPSQASADPPPAGPPIRVSPIGGGGAPVVGIGVHTDPWGRGGGDGNGSPVGYGGGAAGGKDYPCATPTDVSCAAFAHQYKCAVINETFGYSGITDPARMNPVLTSNGCPAIAAGAAPPPPPTAAQLAQWAYGQLRPAAPAPARYPSGTLRDGRPYTIVNTHMWFSTSEASWQPLSKTVCVGALCATATAQPTSLSLDPGNGGQAVSCPGPGTAFVRQSGRSWVPGLQPQGCDYMYRNSTYGSPNGELTATYAITWTVTWTATNGTAGTLNPLTTAAGSTFAVAELQSVVTR